MDSFCKTRGQYKPVGSKCSVHFSLHIPIFSPDRSKTTVQVLIKHADVLHMGQESVDLRLNKDTFTSVQRYFPECDIVVDNFEAYMQEAERQMFPQQRTEEEAWMQAVVQEMVPSVSGGAAGGASSSFVSRKGK